MRQSLRTHLGKLIVRMICTYVLALGLIALTQGCTWLPKVDQQEYCYAAYVFEAEVNEKHTLDGSFGYRHGIAVKKAYKFDGNKEDVLAFKTLYGNGPRNSCGAQILTEGKSYLIYAYRGYLGKLRINRYRPMENVKDSDKERMTTKYDCNCKITFPFRGPRIDLLPPTMDECKVPGKYCPLGSYCKRNSDGRCTWGTFGDCYSY
ncbi:uncharacterized protein LOC125665812 [Ostrea edulis]|uniref:uncharacterized protein LOC125665812 n=1 Tax=Ostrea edulis TaxID=37623 RepID=UPI002094E6A6|nr:uncharacterized protein LOC125665812 [Ostrea edulis]